MKDSYEDMIHLPHHVSPTRPRMPISNRAAQFLPFKAMVGYDAAVDETARLTDTRVELDEYAIAAIDMKLRTLGEAIADRPEVAVTYFQPDEKKDGGAYITAVGNLKKIDEYERAIVLTDGVRIAVQDVLNIECELFGDLI